MNRPALSFLLLLAAAAGMSAERVEVANFLLSKPYPALPPVMVDSTGVDGKRYDPQSALSMRVPVAATDDAADFSGNVLPPVGSPAVQVATFVVDNADYARAKVEVGGGTAHELWVDGAKVEPGEEIAFRPASHSVAVKYLRTAEKPDTVDVALVTDSPAKFALRTRGDRRITLHDILDGRRIAGAEVSPSGRYLLTTSSITENGGAKHYEQAVTATKDGSVVARCRGMGGWIPGKDELWRTVGDSASRRIESFDPATGAVRTVAEGIPEGAFEWSPAADCLVFYKKDGFPAEKEGDIYEIVNPEDRQPGYRERHSLVKYDLSTGVATPLTFGRHDTSFAGMSADGRHLLARTTRQRFEKRPTTVFDLWLVDLATMEGRKIVDGEGFMGAAMLSPDGRSVAVVGSPEAFGGVGKNLPEGMIPSMYDNQLFLVDVGSGAVRPLTRDFNPSVADARWNPSDGKIYFTAENRDRIDLYRVDPTSGAIETLGNKEENVAGFSMASSAPVLAYYGQGASNSDRLYTLDMRRQRHSLVDDVSAERLDGIALGKVEQWDFVSSRGDTVCARYILPPDFDPSKKYPMIVNYYGGCSPTSRAFDTRYPHHVYAANGYVVLVVVPSGASGFGQEHAARHVNTAGEGVAQDIIDGTVQFRDSHPWVDGSRIGCIGASYGGFMTQYLQTVTDIFAAAISHAGISDHTSYWGEGYWGYSYSETSMAESYPWTRKDLYVDHSPLYNADKIHTPLLFLHGDKDNNVPWGESIQMFTALKLLGRPTAFVAVADQDHHILDYDKRIKWQDTIFAWFARYLKDDPSWWDALYPPTPL